MATYRVLDLGAAGSYLAVELRSGSEGPRLSLLLRLVGELYLPDGGDFPPLSSFYAPFYYVLSPRDALGFLAQLVEPSSPSLSDYFSFSISPPPSRYRSYPEPDGGERVSRYHVLRVSLESLTASLLLVDEPQEGDGVLGQIYFPLRSRCSCPDTLKFYE